MGEIGTRSFTRMPEILWDQYSCGFILVPTARDIDVLLQVRFRTPSLRLNPPSGADLWLDQPTCRPVSVKLDSLLYAERE